MVPDFTWSSRLHQMFQTKPGILGLFFSFSLDFHDFRVLGTPMFRNIVLISDFHDIVRSFTTLSRASRLRLEIKELNVFD